MWALEQQLNYPSTVSNYVFGPHHSADNTNELFRGSRLECEDIQEDIFMLIWVRIDKI